MKHKVRLTVIDKKLYPELQQQYCADPNSGACPCYINKGILVTSSYFSRDAFIFTRRQGDLIELINGDALYKMIQKSANRYYDSMQ